METLLRSRLLSVMTVILGADERAAFAQNGTWSADAGGNWSDPLQWSGGTVADGVDFTASFTNDITVTRTVTLDTPRTIGHLTFSDNGANGLPWVLAGPNTLTLDVTSGRPIITTLTDTTIATVLAGTDGLTKTGSGTLFLTNTANTYTGITTGSVGIINVASLANGGVASSLGMSSGAAGNLVLAGGGTQSAGPARRSRSTARTARPAGSARRGRRSDQRRNERGH